MHRYMEYKDEKSNKFWEIKLDAESFTVRYGKIGAKGTEKTKSFDDSEAAEKEANKLIKQKEKKGYETIGDDDSAETETSETAPKEPAKEKPKAAKAEVGEDGLKCVESEDGYWLALEDGKLVAKNPKGKRLKSVAKKQKETETAIKMLSARDWLKDHQTKCLETVESWMLRSLPVPTPTLVAIWKDPNWRSLLQNTIVHPFDDGHDENTGLLRDVDADKGLGLVNIDGDTVWIKPKQIQIPHPVLLEDLDDWRELTAELNVTQGLQQLMRQTFERPDKTEGTTINTYGDAVYEPLGAAMRKAWSLGCRVRGGYATATVWENGTKTDAGYWIGAEDPAYEGYGGELLWTDAEQKTMQLSEVGPVAWSEGVRMAEAIYGIRKVEEEEADQ